MATKQGSYQLQAPQSSTSPVKSLRLLAKAEPEDTLALTLREERRTRNRSHPSGCQQIPSLLMRRLTLNSRAVSQHVQRGGHISECPLVRRNLAETRDHCYETLAEGDVLEEQGNH